MLLYKVPESLSRISSLGGNEVTVAVVVVVEVTVVGTVVVLMLVTVVGTVVGTVVVLTLVTVDTLVEVTGATDLVA
jgi:hypothetical protein